MRKKINKKNFHVLIIRLSSMGDVLLSSALPRLIKSKYPQSKIDFVVASNFYEVLQYNPRIDYIFQYDKSLSAFENRKLFISDIASRNLRKYDLIIDLQNNFRSNILSCGIGEIVKKMNKRRLHKLSLVYLKKSIENPTRQITDIYFDTLSELEISDDDQGLELWLPEEKSAKVYPLPGHNVPQIKSKIALAPGAFHFTKRWLPERFAELTDILCSKYNAEIILLGGTKDMEICNKITSLSKTNITDCSGSTSIVETARLLDDCSLLITNDTGVMHIAAARKIPVVAIFGSTVTEFGFAPYRTKSVIVEAVLPCRPCTHIGRSNCPKGHFNCMNKISVNMVEKAAEELLNIH